MLKFLKTPKHYLWSLMILGFLTTSFTTNAQQQSGQIVKADIVAINLPISYNRLGTIQPMGLMYVLKSDVEKDPNLNTIYEGKVMKCSEVPTDICAGCMRLKEGKRPRPLVLRANEGDILEITLTNWVYPPPPLPGGKNGHSLSSNADTANASVLFVGMTIHGMQYVGNIGSDANFVGSNSNYLVKTNQSRTFKLFAEKEGTFLIRDPASNQTSEVGLFGSLNVQPKGSEWYRSQVTREELYEATTGYTSPNGTAISKSAGATSPDTLPGYPVIDYSKLRMYEQSGNVRTITHTDLTAIITGPNQGEFTGDSPLYDSIPASPNRREPYREISIHYHETLTLSQAFRNNTGYNQLSKEMGAVALQGLDLFSINYGSAGITNEIFSNRIKQGPMANCDECAYEEFFLSSWAVGDPAMVVDNPTGRSPNKATKAFYPDDPSNVYHSYMNDHTIFRIHHASNAIPHVHHQHAHQWLHTRNSPDGHYLDSQTIIPGDSWTLEMVYNGSGNRNKTVGDNIFHCHFYPHFAEGMWALWRVHDVLEAGTKLDANGKPTSSSRALPDGEIQVGTPIPGLVPLPTKAIAPIPSHVHIENGQAIVDIANDQRNPGFPFYIPGVAGNRAPHPPLDFATDENGKPLDGGLPRHLVIDGTIVWEQHTRYDWTKITDNLKAIELPEDGTPVEKIAMATHAKRNHATPTPSGEMSNFVLNGLAPAPGAPFAAPYVNDTGEAVGSKIIYKAANIQIDAALNKSGWHYPQQRIITLESDIAATVSGDRPPEPFFFRANSREHFIEFHHTNLVPEYFELDDFQVRTPTDIIGQHIHLVKFDVTSSDGAANGFNYEDGTFSPGAVQERIHGIKNGSFNKYAYDPTRPVKTSLGSSINTSNMTPTPPNPLWGPAPENQDWAGAQTTVQLWYADPLLDGNGHDRTMRTVFTHDHFGPSTHQQIGLYAGLLIEPDSSVWQNIETGDVMGPGPKKNGAYHPTATSFQANILTADTVNSYREFALEFQDLQLAYYGNSTELDPYPEFPENPADTAAMSKFKADVAAYQGFADPLNSINAPFKGGSTTDAKRSPQIISSAAGGIFGIYSINYRNEMPQMRVKGFAQGQNTGVFNQANGPAGDLSYAYSSNSNISRFDSNYNSQPTLGGPLVQGSKFNFPKTALTPGMQPKDPFTPLLRAYENDKVQIRTLVGAHELPHNFEINGLPWLFEPSAKNSGYRSSQVMGISEHFEMLFTLPAGTAGSNGTTDYMYNASNDNAGLRGGIWGLLRAYNSTQESLVTLPNNEDFANAPKTAGCPTDATKRTFNVSAVMLGDITDSDDLIYKIVNDTFNLVQRNALIFVEDKDLDSNGKLKANRQIEPMVLRANAGECISITLTNKLNPSSSIFPQYIQEGYSNNFEASKSNQVRLTASGEVGLHAQLLSYDANKSDGQNVGMNDIQTVAPDQSKTYEYYAGKWEDGEPVPVEFGTVLLTSSDIIDHYARGLFGAIIIEPENSTYTLDQYTDVSGTIHTNSGSFREFVIFAQDDLSLNKPSISHGINYKTEPYSYRLGQQNGVGIHDPWYSWDADANFAVLEDPQTPIFTAGKGMPIRLRLTQAGGSGEMLTFVLAGHGFEEEPYQENSTVIGHNRESSWLGSRPQVAPNNTFDLIIESAGGKKRIAGDYLYRFYQSEANKDGAWGLMRVTDGKDEPVAVELKINTDGTVNIRGTATINPQNGIMPTKVTLVKAGTSAGSSGNLSGKSKATTTSISPLTKHWEFKNLPGNILQAESVRFFTNQGGKRVYTKEQLLGLDSRNEIERLNTPLPRDAEDTQSDIDRIRKTDRVLSTTGGGN